MAPTQNSQPKQSITRNDKARVPSTSDNKIVKSTSTSKSKLKARALDHETKPRAKRRPGRYFKMPPPPGASQSQSAQPSPSSSTDAPIPPPRRLCMLEALPVEVIEKIFLYALEPNLPRASLPLAAALSSERIYRIITLLAFWDDPADHKDPVGPAIKKILSPVDYDYIGKLPWERRARVQAQIFNCKWCTMERILKQVPTMMVLTIHRTWLDAGVKMDHAGREALERFMDRKDDSTLSFMGTGPILFHFAKLTGLPRSQVRQLDPRPFHEYEMRLTPMAEVEIMSHSARIINPFPVLSLCAVPDKLLRGRSTGFTPEDVAFLEMLRITSNNYKHVDAKTIPCSDTRINRSALHEGVRNAINTQNFNALISLLKFDEFVFRFREANQGRPVFYKIPPEHFELVTRVGRQNPSLNHAFFEALLRASAESVPASSPAIIQWTIDNVRLGQRDPNPYFKMNARFAQWLSDFKIRLPDQIDFTRDDPKMQLFTCGQLNVNDVEGCLYLDQVLDNGEAPGNWTAESAFFRKNPWVEHNAYASLTGGPSPNR